MNQISLKLKVYFYSCMSLGLISVAMYTLSYLFDFDTDINYFSGGVLSTLSLTLMLLTLIWTASAFVFIPRSVMTDKISRGLFTRISSLTLAVSHLAYAIIRILNFDEISLFGYIVIAFAFASAISLLLYARYTVPVPIGALLLFFPLFRAAGAMVEFYLDISIPMNSPIKIFQMIAALSFVLFILYEMRYCVGAARPRAFFISALVSALFTALFSIPFLIISILGTSILPEFIPDAILLLFAPAYILFSARDCLKSNTEN